MAIGSSARRSSNKLASVGHMRARSSPSSSIKARRGSGEKNASGERIGSPISSRRVFPSGLPFLKSSSDAPGRPTTLNVGLGMYSEMTLRTAILVRPLTSTYLISPEYWGGRNFVKASVVSYMWLSASKTGKSTMGFGMTTSGGRDRNSAVRLHEAGGYFQLRRQYYRKGGRPAQIGALSGTRPHRDALARPRPPCKALH